MSEVVLPYVGYTKEEIDDCVRVLGGYAGACDCLGQYMEATHIYDAIGIIKQLQNALALANANNLKIHAAYVRNSV